MVQQRSQMGQIKETSLICGVFFYWFRYSSLVSWSQLDRHSNMHGLAVTFFKAYKWNWSEADCIVRWLMWACLVFSCMIFTYCSFTNSVNWALLIHLIYCIWSGDIDLHKQLSYWHGVLTKSKLTRLFPNEKQVKRKVTKPTCKISISISCHYFSPKYCIIIAFFNFYFLLHSICLRAFTSGFSYFSLLQFYTVYYIHDTLIYSKMFHLVPKRCPIY